MFSFYEIYSITIDYLLFPNCFVLVMWFYFIFILLTAFVMRWGWGARFLVFFFLFCRLVCGLGIRLIRIIFGGMFRWRIVMRWKCRCLDFGKIWLFQITIPAHPQLSAFRLDPHLAMTVTSWLSTFDNLN